MSEVVQESQREIDALQSRVDALEAIGVDLEDQCSRLQVRSAFRIRSAFSPPIWAGIAIVWLPLEAQVHVIGNFMHQTLSSSMLYESLQYIDITDS